MSEDEVVVSDRDFWVLGAACSMLALTLGTLIVCVFLLVGQARNAGETHNALCVFRASLATQAAETNAYLLAHPHGVPALGITAAQLAATRDRERLAAESLSELNCA